MRPLLLRETRPQLVEATPRAVATRILEARYGDRGGTASTVGLTTFQESAVRRARGILARYGGVLIADSVGLGKTHIALALVASLNGSGGRTAVIGPAALHRHWHHAAGAAARFEWISYARLARGGIREDVDTVVFDEAHALRNPRTRRYREAAALCRKARVVLLTATPVNNTIWDLYHLLRLFAGDRDFADAGVASLRSAFEEAEGSAVLGAAPSIQPVLRSVMIRRTRDSPGVTGHLRVGIQGAGLQERDALAFPQRTAPLTIRYSFDARDGDALLDAIAGPLQDLEFPAHRRIGVRGRVETPVALMRLALLKRLESSVHALEQSASAYLRLLERCLNGLSRGMLIRASDPLVSDASDGQLSLDALLYATLPAGFDIDGHRTALETEIARVRAMRSAIAPALRNDGKLAALAVLLRTTLRGRKVLVFTQFRDTAAYIHGALHRELRTALVDGREARLGAQVSDRQTVLRRFAPAVNGAPQPPGHEAVDVLVATDVLSEGFNLQDADVVVSYDLPWNPIRMVQRVGRIDRLGRSNRSIASYHFMPGELERYLGLLRRLAAKVTAIDVSVGSDMPELHARLAAALDAQPPLSRGAGPDAAAPDANALDERLQAALDDVHREAARGDGHDADGPPRSDRSITTRRAMVASMPGRRGSGPSGLVAARVGGRFEWVLVRDGTPMDDDRVCAKLLEVALASQGSPTAFAPVSSPPTLAPEASFAALATEAPSSDLAREASRLIARARPVLARRLARRSTTSLLPAGGAGARIARRLLARAAELPGGPDGATCERIERCLGRLAALAPDMERALARTLPPDDGRADCLALCAAIEAAAARQPARQAGVFHRPASDRLPAEAAAPVQLVGILVETRGAG